MKKPKKFIVQELWVKILAQQQYQKKEKQNGWKTRGAKEVVESRVKSKNKIKKQDSG